MAFGSDRSANFVVKAKDAATGPLGRIGGAMGRLKSAGVSAFKAIAGTALAAASAIAGFTIAAIKGAIDDEKAQARLNATLRARGLLTEKNTAAIEKAIEAGQRLAFTDDDVRASIENATQFTDKFNKALKIQAVAQDLAVAKGIDLATATSIVGKAFTGNGKALKGYGIELQKTVHWTETKINKDKTGYQTEEKVAKSRKETIKGMAALNLITEKFGGIAEEVGQTTAVKLESALIGINEKIEAFGAKFLPAVNEGLTFFTETILPMVTPALDFLGDLIFSVGNAFAGKGGIVESVGKVVGPLIEDLLPTIESIAGAIGGLFDAVGQLIGALWGNGNGALANVIKIIGGLFKGLLDIIKPVIDAFAWIIKNLAGILNFFTASAKAQPPATPKPGQPGGSSYTTGGATSVTTNTNLYLDGRVVANSTNSYLAGQANAATGSRTSGRGY